MDKYLKIKNQFEINKDDGNAIDMARYMKDKFKFYGIPAAKRKDIYKELLKEEKKSKIIDWSFLDKCYEDEHREFQYLVTDYLIKMQKFLSYDDIPRVKKYIKAKQWWDTIDFFDGIIGDIGLNDLRVDDLMIEWSLDEDIWLRRIAIDHQLKRKDKTNEDLLEKILINNLGSNEFFINKAIGWSLRAYSKVDSEWVRNFIDKYGDKMSKLSIREGSKYI